MVNIAEKTIAIGTENVKKRTMMKNQIIRFCYIMIILLCLGSCGPGHNDYSYFHNISSDGWKYGDTLSFNPDLHDSIVNGELNIVIRHSNAYAYSNLWLEIRHFNGIGTRVDTVNIEMADVYGRWYGNGLGSSFQYQLPVSHNITLYKGKPINIRHIMRVDKLEAIEQIGLLFTEQDK